MEIKYLPNPNGLQLFIAKTLASGTIFIKNQF